MALASNTFDWRAGSDRRRRGGYYTNDSYVDDELSDYNELRVSRRRRSTRHRRPKRPQSDNKRYDWYASDTDDDVYMQRRARSQQTTIPRFEVASRRRHSVDSLEKRRRNRRRNPYEGRELYAHGNGDPSAYYNRQIIANAQYPSRHTLQSPRHYRQRQHNNERRHSSAEGTLERELRRDHITMSDTLPELTITADLDERWHEDLPRYHVPNRTYLESIHHPTSLSRSRIPVGSRLPSRAQTPAPDVISHISIAAPDWPVSLEWHRFFYGANRAPGFIFLTCAVLLLVSQSRHDLSSVQAALAVTTLVAGAFILLSWLYCQVWPEGRSISRARLLVLTRIVHAIGHGVLGALIIAAGIWTWVCVRQNADGDTENWSRADIGLLAAASGVLALIFSAVTIVVGFYTIDQLRQRERAALGTDEMVKTRFSER